MKTQGHNHLFFIVASVKIKIYFNVLATTKPRVTSYLNLTAVKLARKCVFVKPNFI